MPNYSNTIIYKICCDDERISDIYVGHTTNITSRCAEHKYNCCNKKSKSYEVYMYSFIRENGGWDNWYMIEIERYPCENKHEALMRENYYVKLLNSSLNKLSPIKDLEKKKRYIEQKRIENAEMSKIRREKRREERLKHLQENAELIKKHKHEIRKAHALKNREKINAMTREYNRKNNEKFREKSRRYYRNKVLRNKSALIIQQFFKKLIKRQ